MFKRTVVGLGLAWFIGCPAATMGEEIKSVDEVIAKHVEAIGGRSAIDSMKTLRLSGKNVMAGGMEMPITIVFRAPNSMRLDLTFQGMEFVQAYDGSTGWRIMPFSGDLTPQKMSPEEAELFQRETDMQGPLVDYAKKGHKVELLGVKETDGSDMYEIKLTRGDGSVEHHFLDAEFFLPLKVTGVKKTQGMELEFTTSFSDYKKVGEAMIAHSMTNQATGNPMASSTLTFDKVEINVDVPGSFFAMPEVKAPTAAAKPAPVNTGAKAPVTDKP